MSFLHQLDVLAYRLVVGVWDLYWPVLAVVFLLSLAERRFSIEKAQPWRAWWFNIVWHAGLLAMVVAMSWTAWTEFIAWLGSAGHWLPWRMAAPQGPLDAWVRVALGLVVHDFFNYWAHRLQHRLPALWAIHQFHHDERHVNASTSLRSHWLGILFVQVVVLVPMMWLLGFEAMSPAVFVVLGIFAALTHVNVDIGFGRFSTWLVSPRYHRNHHARERSLHDSNYAEMFPLWDIVFGTFTSPARHSVQATGLGYVPATDSFGPAFVQPLVDWARMLRSATTRL